jgi:hypothetical protein
MQSIALVCNDRVIEGCAGLNRQLTLATLEVVKLSAAWPPHARGAGLSVATTER